MVPEALGHAHLEVREVAPGAAPGAAGGEEEEGPAGRRVALVPVVGVVGQDHLPVAQDQGGDLGVGVGDVGAVGFRPRQAPIERAGLDW